MSVLAGTVAFESTSSRAVSQDEKTVTSAVQSTIALYCGTERFCFAHMLTGNISVENLISLQSLIGTIHGAQDHFDIWLL